MKTITLVTLIAFMAFGQTMVAQDTDLSELLNRLHGNHMGSIYDVFTKEEVAQLQVHFDAKNNVEPVRYVGSMPIRATENTVGNSVIINPSNLSMVEIVAPSPLMAFEGAGAIIPDTADAIVVDGDNNFYGVQPNGNYIQLTTIAPPAGQSFTGLEFTSDGDLYGIATDGMGTTNLYKINLAESSLMSVGGPNGLVVGIALGRDMSNNLYSYDIDTDQVHRIDRNTGIATALGPIGFDAEFGQGMSYDPTSGNLMATVFNADTFKPELRMINTTHGGSTFIGTIVPSQTYQFAWMGIFDPTLGTNEMGVSHFTLYPNPAKNVLTITAEVTIQTIKMYNTLGQEVLAQVVDDTTTAIDVSTLAKGVYIVQITAEDSQTALQFIKE